MNISDILQYRVQQQPDKIILCSYETDTAYTYQEMVDRSLAVAGSFTGTGSSTPSISIFARNTTTIPFIVMGCWLTGWQPSAFNHRANSHTLEHHIKIAETDVLVYDDSTRESVMEAATDDVETIHIEAIDESDPVDIEQDTVGKGTTAFLGFTSGTTGMPKGVPFTHDRYIHASVMELLEPEGTAYLDPATLDLPQTDDKYRSMDTQAPRLSEDDIREVMETESYGETQLLSRQMFHTPVWTQIIASILTNTLMVIPESTDNHDILAAVEGADVNLMDAVPTRYKMLAERADQYDTRSLSYLHVGGGALPETVYEMMQENLSDNIVHEYACSECYQITYSHNDESLTIGGPRSLQSIKLIEPGANDPAKDGVSKGELAVRTDSPLVFDGYRNQPGKTEEAIVDGWYLTDDIVEIKEGRLYYCSREDDIIMSGGEHIPPAEVEETLLKHPAVESAGVIGAPSEKWGEKTVAIVSTDEADGADELDAFCKESQLENFKRPKEYRFVDSIPHRSTSGVDRQALRDRYLE